MRMRLTAVLVVVSGLIAVSSAVGFSAAKGGRKDVEVGAKKASAKPQADLAAEAEAQMQHPFGVPPLTIDPFHTWKGEEARLQELLVSQLNQAGFARERRRAHFQWVEEFGGTIEGWLALAMEVTPTEDGVVIKLMVSPLHTAGVTRVNDVVYETYLLTDGGPTLLSFQEDPTPKITVW